MAGTRFASAVSSKLKMHCRRKIRIYGENRRPLIKAEATRIIKEKETKEIRYHISDEQGVSTSYFNAPVRGRRGIENHLHRHSDVTFKEDNCRARKGNAPENLSTLRKLALQILHDRHDRLSLKKRRLKAAYDMTYLKKLVT
jgi:predicted transposase YbfD/YdcC